MLWLWNTTLPRVFPGRVRGLRYGEALRLMLLAWLLFGAGAFGLTFALGAGPLVGMAPEACDLLIEAGHVVPVVPHGVVLARSRGRGARRRDRRGACRSPMRARVSRAGKRSRAPTPR